MNFLYMTRCNHRPRPSTSISLNAMENIQMLLPRCSPGYSAWILGSWAGLSLGSWDTRMGEGKRKWQAGCC
uniref:Uncharacterized protein n=1 Tax=Picea glauca TaxID=3330 RepID=A0A101M326_PICGL|nr:hypothetical protein ABT39_MTgene3282 [Picea glauca]QHR89209.1 hypothetical protein Q903MT_gene3229 [Picea sitchensis]